MHVAVALLLALLALSNPPALHAETIGGNPGPQHNYVCPHADGEGALDCYFDAVQHLYTMCRNVKSIEIIEFGYENSGEGLNAAKSESCFVKQKQNIDRPYQAALKEARVSQQAVEGLRGLQEAWASAMTQLAWQPGESGDDYSQRVVRPYDDFKARIAGIRTIVAVVEKRTEPARPAKSTAKAKPQSKSKAKAKPN
jgi:hypothetical protein